jgi:hypothetical protein
LECTKLEIRSTWYVIINWTWHSFTACVGLLRWSKSRCRYSFYYHRRRGNNTPAFYSEIYAFNSYGCDELITRPRSPTDCPWSRSWGNSALCSKSGSKLPSVEAKRKKKILWQFFSFLQSIKSGFWIAPKHNKQLCPPLHQTAQNTV